MAEPLPTENQGEVDSEEEFEAEQQWAPEIKKIDLGKSKPREYVHVQCPVQENRIKKGSWRDFYVKG